MHGLQVFTPGASQIQEFGELLTIVESAPDEATLHPAGWGVEQQSLAIEEAVKVNRRHNGKARHIQPHPAPPPPPPPPQPPLPPAP
jgi:hypothetical protein